jgi:hypothetical protein
MKVFLYLYNKQHNWFPVLASMAWCTSLLTIPPICTWSHTSSSWSVVAEASLQVQSYKIRYSLSFSFLICSSYSISSSSVQFSLRPISRHLSLPTPAPTSITWVSTASDLSCLAACRGLESGELNCPVELLDGDWVGSRLPWAHQEIYYGSSGMLPFKIVQGWYNR